MRGSRYAITIASLLVASLSMVGCQKMGRRHPVGEGIAETPPVDPGGGEVIDPNGGDGDCDDGDNGGGGGDGGGGGNGGDGGNLDAPVPEPATLALIGGGLAGLALLRRKKRNA